MKPRALIVGLGNPGKAYEGTRHNIGFAALDKLAQKHGFSFRGKAELKSKVATGQIGDTPVILLKPQTYMNLSGEAVNLAIRYFEIDLSRLLVLVDDVAIPLGQLRFREKGSSGGHNGLKSIAASLDSMEYSRLRIGVGDPLEGDLSDHVLGPFSAEEKKLIPDVLEQTVQATEMWLDQGINSAMNAFN